MTSTSKVHSPTPRPVREVLHGIEVEDPFRWLEDQDSPETRSFIEAEQDVYREYLDRHQRLRSRIERRVTQLLAVPSVDLPVPDQHGGLVYLKREAETSRKGSITRGGTIRRSYSSLPQFWGRILIPPSRLFRSLLTAAISYLEYGQAARTSKKSASTI